MSPSFPFPLAPVLLSHHFSRQQNSFFLSFLLSSLSFFSFHASRIGTCPIHAHLINDIFNLTDEFSSRYEDLKDERDLARRENQTLKKEIKELKKKSEDYEQENQALQKNLESTKEERRKVQLLSRNLEAEKKEQEEKIRLLQMTNEELQDTLTNKTSKLEELAQNIQQLEGE